MGYYENIAACKTEKELLELWKTKKPDTKGSTFDTLNRIVYGEKIRPKGIWCDNWFYYTDMISNNKTLIIDYYHPANHYPALVNYYAVTNIYQQALFKPYFTI